jgi:hypothetical protein
MVLRKAQPMRKEAREDVARRRRAGGVQWRCPEIPAAAVREIASESAPYGKIERNFAPIGGNSWVGSRRPFRRG